MGRKFGSARICFTYIKFMQKQGGEPKKSQFLENFRKNCSRRGHWGARARARTRAGRLLKTEPSPLRVVRKNLFSVEASWSRRLDASKRRRLDASTCRRVDASTRRRVETYPSRTVPQLYSGLKPDSTKHICYRRSNPIIICVAL